MKKFAKLLSVLFLFGIIFIACEGPEGIGGLNGIDGLDGADGTATCAVCHEGNTIANYQVQFYSSQHFSGDLAVDYAGGRSYCAECHSHEGYLEWSVTGDVASNISNPSAWQCATCHTLHSNFDVSDWGFRADGEFTMIADGTTSFDQGINNVCANCHQSRRNDGYYDKYTTAQTFTATIAGADYANHAHGLSMGPTGSITYDNGVDTLKVSFDVPTTHVYVSSTHAGPHYGVQANVFAGIGGAGVDDGAIFGSHGDGCTTCHMGEDKNHSFMAKDANCTTSECHTNIPTTAMDEIEARLEAIAEELESLHALHYSDEDKSYHPLLSSLTRDQFQALWNYFIVANDRSKGAHNPTYIRALLFDAETKLGLI